MSRSILAGISAICLVVLVGVGTTHPRRQNRWGMSLLRHLQYTLNASQDLDSGLHEFEQNETPTSVGQRSLEWADRIKIDGGVEPGDSD